MLLLHTRRVRSVKPTSIVPLSNLDGIRHSRECYTILDLGPIFEEILHIFERISYQSYPSDTEVIHNIIDRSVMLKAFRTTRVIRDCHLSCLGTYISICFAAFIVDKAFVNPYSWMEKPYLSLI